MRATGGDPLVPRGPKSSWASRRGRRLPSAVVHGSLDDGMKVCLGLLARDPDLFELAAVAWHARWCAHLHDVAFADSHAALCALEALAGPEPSAGARALSATCCDCGLDEVAAVLREWLECRSRSAAVGPSPDPAAVGARGRLAGGYQ